MNLKLKSIIALALTTIMAVSSIPASALDLNPSDLRETDIEASAITLDSHYIESDTGHYFDMDKCLQSIALANDDDDDDDESNSMSNPERIYLQAHDEVRIYTAEQLEGKNYSWSTVLGSGSPDCASITVKSDGMYIVAHHPETEFLQVTIGSTTEYFLVTIYLADAVYTIDNTQSGLRLQDTDDFYEGKKAQLFTKNVSTTTTNEDLMKIIHVSGTSYCIRSMLNSSMALCKDGDNVVFKTIGTSNDSIPTEALWTITVSDLYYGNFNITSGNALTSPARSEGEVTLTALSSSEYYQVWNISEYTVPSGSSSFTGVVIPNSIERLGVGEKYKLAADIYSYQPDDNGQNGFTWSVTNGTGSATISTDGTLTGVSKGTVTVTATYNQTSYSTTITIDITDPIDGVYYMRNIASGKTVTGNSSYITWAVDYNTDDEQKWLIELNSNGYYTIRSEDGLNYLCFGTPNYGDPLLYWNAYVSTYSDWCIVYTDSEYRIIPSILTESGARIYITTDNQIKITWDNSIYDERGLWTLISVDD